MSHNCVNYGGHSNAQDKLRISVGQPDYYTHPKQYVKNILATPDCISCQVEKLSSSLPSQCKACMMRRVGH